MKYMYFEVVNNLHEVLCPPLLQDIIREVIKRRKVLGFSIPMQGMHKKHLI